MKNLIYINLLITALCVFGCQTTKPQVTGTKLDTQQAPKSPQKTDRSDKQSGINEIKATDVHFNNKTGEITYTLSQEAMVRVRIGINNGGPLLRTLTDWTIQEKGKHSIVWDFKDTSGEIDFGQKRNYLVAVQCLPADEVAREEYDSDVKGKRLTPGIKVMLAEKYPLNSEGISVTKGVVPIRTKIDSKDRKWLMQTKYELGIFVDGVFLAEDEEGIDPYNYRFNTRGFHDGLHMLTVNIIGYEGEVGTNSMMVEIKN